MYLKIASRKDMDQKWWICVCVYKYYIKLIESDSIIWNVPKDSFIFFST